MNTIDNIGWLDDFAVNSLEKGNVEQADRLYMIAKWIGEANTVLAEQNGMLAKLHKLIKSMNDENVLLKERVDTLYRENEALYNRVARSGI